MRQSPYHHPEFIRTINYVPFDPETDAEARRQDAQRACMFFALNQKQRRREIGKGLYFTFIMAIVIFAAWCLLAWNR